MPEWLKELFISIGGGSIVAGVFYIGLKTVVAKIVDKAIDTSFEKSTLKLSNRLERTTKAYEILLKKEFDYYEKLDSYLARIIPLVQDLVYNVDKFQNNNDENARDRYRELCLEYIDMIPEIKNHNLIVQAYIPENIFEATTILVKNMQSDLQYLSFVGKVLYGNNDGSVDIKKIEEIKDKVLKSVALVESRIKNRLVELSHG